MISIEIKLLTPKCMLGNVGYYRTDRVGGDGGWKRLTVDCRVGEFVGGFSTINKTARDLGGLMRTHSLSYSHTHSHTLLSSSRISKGLTKLCVAHTRSHKNTHTHTSDTHEGIYFLSFSFQQRGGMLGVGGGLKMRHSRGGRRKRREEG